MNKKKTQKKTEIKTPQKHLQKTDHQYFVLLHYPREFRRTLLEGSRGIIYALQKYHNLKLLREEKRRQIHILRSHMKEITFLMTKLKDQLPEDIIPPDVPVPKVTAVSKQKPEKQPKLPAADLDKLTKTLSSIEERLNRL